ncbi:hypothetical protein HDV01_002983 [Terramyces sp. JEL0728]|nr:hypothetical protein HDV01_002983 [Terramyces sp. JEL0728]
MSAIKNQISKLTPKQLQLIQSMLRVDHAGEIGANWIYKGQHNFIKDKESKDKIREMWNQEKHHLKVFDEILANTKTRPSLLRPFWELAGYTLGSVTAMMGKEAAMACTEAVETVIGQHYNDQIRKLYGSEDPEIQKLLEVLKEFRDDELEHLDTAIQMDSKKAPFYDALSGVIQVGCKTAIKIAEKI